MEEYRIDIKVRNNLILKKLKEAGYDSIGGFCRKNNLMNQVGRLGDVLNMKISPLNSKGEFITIVQKLCDIINCCPEDLFTQTQLTTALATNRRTLEVNEAEMKYLIENTTDQKLLEDQYSDNQMTTNLENILNTLTPREQQVLKLRFGEDKNYREIGEILGCSNQRIIQIEHKALRKLRDQSKSDILREFM